MQYTQYFSDTTSRLHYLIDELTAACDLDFDNHREELEREFAELRLSCVARDGR